MTNDKIDVKLIAIFKSLYFSWNFYFIIFNEITTKKIYKILFTLAQWGNIKILKILATNDDIDFDADDGISFLFLNYIKKNLFKWFFYI